MRRRASCDLLTFVTDWSLTIPRILNKTKMATKKRGNSHIFSSRRLPTSILKRKKTSMLASLTTAEWNVLCFLLAAVFMQYLCCCCSSFHAFPVKWNMLCCFLLFSCILAVSTVHVVPWTLNAWRIHSYICIMHACKCTNYTSHSLTIFFLKFSSTTRTKAKWRGSIKNQQMDVLSMSLLLLYTGGRWSLVSAPYSLNT
jgi:hypothetical protein